MFRSRLLPISLFTILGITLFSVSACKKHKIKKQKEADEKTITDYISSHQLNATATGSGLYYMISSQGSGVQPISTSTVTVKYKGYFTDGKTFDQSDTGATFPLSNVIKGWQEGIPLFKKGGKGMLLIPSALGYGPKGTLGVPPNSVLIFDVELRDVK
jgi:FKBP-type peptidyl-prolyl cis-trans isomerase FkpA